MRLTHTYTPFTSFQATPQRRRNVEETRSTTHRTHDEPAADKFMTSVRSDVVERLE